MAAEHGRYIVSYVRPDQGIQPKAEMPVQVRLRAASARPLPSKVESIGPQIEQIPQHQCRDPRVPEWGLPVRIRIPFGCAARPGELLDVSFLPKG